MTDIPHLRVPLTFVDGQLATVEQGTTEEVTQCVEAILRFRRGDRLARPGFGIADLTWRPMTPGGIRIDDVIAAVGESESRLGVLFSQGVVSTRNAMMGVVMRVQTTGGASNG